MKLLRPLYVVLLICFIVLAVYYPVIFAPFNSIDDTGLVNYLLNLNEVDTWQLLFPNVGTQYYRPLVMATFVADSYVWGLLASFMHLENILLHLGSTILVYLITCRLLVEKTPQNILVASITAILFGLHPIATEAVNWISGRTDVLAGFFVLASFLLFLKGQLEQKYWPVLLGGGLLLAGSLSKETALFFFPVLFIWCLFPPSDLDIQSSTRFKAVTCISYLAFSGLFLVLRWVALKNGDKIVRALGSLTSSSGDAFNLLDVVRVSLKASGFYLKKLIIPTPLNFGIVGVAPEYILLGVMVAVGIMFCLYKRNVVSYLLLAAFFLILPSLVLPLLKVTWTPIAERYAYIASAPFLIAVSLCYIKYVHAFIPSKPVIFIVVILLISVGVITNQRNLIWQDNLTLFEDTVKKSPGFAAAKNELAIALYERGRISEANKLLLANRGDDFQPSFLNKAKVFINKGDLNEAKKLLITRVDKDISSLVLLIKVLDLQRETTDEAGKIVIDRDLLQYLQQALNSTGDSFYHYRVGQVQMRLAQRDAAKESFKKAWQGSSPNSHYHDAAKKLAERL